METHNEDYYWVTGEVLTEEQFIEDASEDGLWMKPEVRKVLWTMGEAPQRKLRPFGFNSNARGPDEVNI